MWKTCGKEEYQLNNQIVGSLKRPKYIKLTDWLVKKMMNICSKYINKQKLGNVKMNKYLLKWQTRTSKDLNY